MFIERFCRQLLLLIVLQFILIFPPDCDSDYILFWIIIIFPIDPAINKINTQKFKLFVIGYIHKIIYNKVLIKGLCLTCTMNKLFYITGVRYYTIHV